MNDSMPHCAAFGCNCQKNNNKKIYLHCFPSNNNRKKDEKMPDDFKAFRADRCIQI